jgi:subtilisin-like proprotein convertase family protein
VDNDTNPTRRPTDITGDHGTSVAGLIAASGWNNKGGRGVSPKVSLKGFNFLQNQLLNNKIAALGGATYSQDVDIFVLSFGVSAIEDYLVDSTLETAIANIMTTLRGGKGPIYVKAAGNGFEKYSGFYLDSNGVWKTAQANCNNATSTKLTCQNANMDPDNTLPYNIVVGALTGEGIKSSYSTAGSAIWISAPGGEHGHNSAYVTSANYQLKPAMMTTDQSGCNQGYVRNGITDANGFNPSHINNSSCNYTSTFNGTSSAVPVTSGAIALMLEANPNLSWRDVKHILAKTATQVNTTLTDTTVSLSGSNYIAEPTWLTNNAGYKFHNYYGFGRIDVAAAVDMAKTYTANSLGSFRTSDWQNSGTLNKTITNDSITNAAEHQLTLTSSQSMIIEAVQIKVNITHDRTGDLGIELISPNGTRSVLFNINNGFSNDQNLANMVLLSNAFYGENSSNSSGGPWTIRVVDGYSTGSNGTLTSWAIRFFGH